MKIKRIVAENVYGYMNFDEKIEHDVTFFIGCNGSGKTTLLKLVRALLEPSLELLLKIEYSYVKLQLDADGKDVFISSTKNDKKVNLEIKDGDNEPLNDSFDILLKKEELELLTESNEMLKKIKEYDCFGYINVNRIFRYKERKFGIFSEKESLQNKQIPDIDIAISYIQDLVYRKTMNTNIQKNFLGRRFRDDLIKKTLEVKTNTFSKMNDDNLYLLKEELDKKREKYLSLMSTIFEDKFDFDTLFKDLKEIINKLISIKENASFNEKNPPMEYYDLILQWIINQDNINRIDQMIELGAKYNDKIAKIQEASKNFVDILNVFFEQSGKNIRIDERGSISAKVLRSGKSIELQNMSSGEKHLIVIFAFLMFYIKRKSIIVIDEPEISLHIGWQEIFVDSLLKANPNIQYILATHAPSIISRKERQEWCINLTRN